MKRVAFKMKLLNGCAAEYKKRHEEIWPELVDLLKMAGISDYSIFLDGDTGFLYAILKSQDMEKMDQLSTHAIMQNWWKYMSDIMESDSDYFPVSMPLNEIFYMP